MLYSRDIEQLLFAQSLLLAVLDSSEQLEVTCKHFKNLLSDQLPWLRVGSSKLDRENET